MSGQQTKADNRIDDDARAIIEKSADKYGTGEVPIPQFTDVSRIVPDDVRKIIEDAADVRVVR